MPLAKSRDLKPTKHNSFTLTKGENPMLELTVTIATILILHYLATSWRRRKASHQRLLATNQIEKRSKRKPILIIKGLLSRGRL